MSKFSLITVSSEKDGFITGYWIQDHVGTLETAKAAAIATEKVNSNKIDVAVVEQVSTTVPLLHNFTDLKRLI